MANHLDDMSFQGMVHFIANAEVGKCEDILDKIRVSLERGDEYAVFSRKELTTLEGALHSYITDEKKKHKD